MGVYIRGMEIPTRCGRCDMRIPVYDDGIFDHYECCITAAIIDNLGEKMDDCPLVPIPQHGRLIDADALDASLKEMSEIEWNQKAFPVSWAYAFEAFRGIIERDEPAVIQAEEDE